MHIRKETLAIGTLLFLTLIISGVVVSAGNLRQFDIDSYVKVAKVATLGMSNEQIMSVYNKAYQKLSQSDKQILSNYNSQQVLEVAKGSQQGQAIVQALTPNERSAANNLLGVVNACSTSGAENPQECYKAGIWGGSNPPATAPAPPVAPAPPASNCPVPTGPCIVPQTMCKEYILPNDRIACQYSCTPGPPATWGPGTECLSGWCHGNHCM